MSTIGVGIIGCGRMGRERARCAQASGARIVGVCDADAARAAELAAQYGTTVADTPEELAACDALFLCTPPDARPDQALRAVHAQIPFFSEKPIATDHGAAGAVLDALAGAPVVNAVGYMNRWRASVQHARRTLEGRRVLGMTAHWVNRAYRVPWWLDARASGGPHNEQATHLYDLARHLCGEVDSVSALAPTAGDDAPLGVAAALRFASGALGTILYSCEATAKDIGARIFTTEGSIAFSTWDFTLVENTIDGSFPSAGLEDVFLRETGEFLEAVRRGTPSPAAADWNDAVRTQRVLDEVRACLSAGAPPGAARAR